MLDRPGPGPGQRQGQGPRPGRHEILPGVRPLIKYQVSVLIYHTDDLTPYIELVNIRVVLLNGDSEEQLEAGEKSCTERMMGTSKV